MMRRFNYRISLVHFVDNLLLSALDAGLWFAGPSGLIRVCDLDGPTLTFDHLVDTNSMLVSGLPALRVRFWRLP